MILKGQYDGKSAWIEIQKVINGHDNIFKEDFGSHGMTTRGKQTRVSYMLM
jgi:hypothetical protein